MQPIGQAQEFLRDDQNFQNQSQYYGLITQNRNHSLEKKNKRFANLSLIQLIICFVLVFILIFCIALYYIQQQQKKHQEQIKKIKEFHQNEKQYLKNVYEKQTKNKEDQIVKQKAEEVKKVLNIQKKYQENINKIKQLHQNEKDYLKKIFDERIQQMKYKQDQMYKQKVQEIKKDLKVQKKSVENCQKQLVQKQEYQKQRQQSYLKQNLYIKKLKKTLQAKNNNNQPQDQNISLYLNQAIKKNLNNTQILDWPQKLYSQMQFNEPNITNASCPYLQFPMCDDLQWQVQAINEKDVQNMQLGNITEKSIKTSRKFFKLGLNDPSEQLLEEERSYYLQKYPDFFDYKEQLPFCIVILSYKNVQYNRYLFALKTVLRQKYTNYHIVYVDDQSLDGTGYLARKYIDKYAENPQKHKVIINNFRKKSLQNNYIFSHQYCNQHDIQFFAPDGDDGIVGVLTFQLYNYYYQKYDIWVSWGATIFINGQLWAAGNIPQQQIKNENLKCCMYNYVHHPKVFFNRLWTFTNVQRLLYQDGKFYPSTGDNILTRSLSQMGRYHLKQISQPVYLYYNAHQLNVGRIEGPQLSMKRFDYIYNIQQILGAVDCLFPMDNGTCLKASNYVLAYQRGEIDNIQNKSNIPEKIQRSFNKYPKEILSDQIEFNINSFQNQQKLKVYNISNQSFDLAKQYLKIGLNQPNQQLIKKQKIYYQNKYQLYSDNQTQIEFPFCIFISGYNNIQNQRYKLVLNSVFRQDYQNYRIVYIDDHSSKGDPLKIYQYIKQKSQELKVQNPQKHIFIQGKIKRNATFNHYIYGKEYCNKYDLQFQIDGNDGLVGTQVFKLYNYYFQKNNIWAAWGSYLNTYSKQIKSLNPLKNQQISFNLFQSHPIVFYQKLWMMVKPRQLLNKQGWFYWTGTNLATIKRICQLSGQKRILYIPQLIYLKTDNHQYSQQYLYNDIDQNLQRIKLFKYNKLHCLIGTPIQESPFDSYIVNEILRIRRSQNCLQTRNQIFKYWINNENKY